MCRNHSISRGVPPSHWDACALRAARHLPPPPAWLAILQAAGYSQTSQCEKVRSRHLQTTRGTGRCNARPWKARQNHLLGHGMPKTDHLVAHAALSCAIQNAPLVLVTSYMRPMRSSSSRTMLYVHPKFLGAQAFGMVLWHTRASPLVPLSWSSDACTTASPNQQVKQKLDKKGGSPCQRKHRTCVSARPKATTPGALQWCLYNCTSNPQKHGCTNSPYPQKARTYALDKSNQRMHFRAAPVHT